MSKHTPGPWVLMEIGDKCKHLCPAKDNMSILTVALEYHDEDDGEPTYFGAVYSPEDAHLIAAAPDLLDVAEIAEDTPSAALAMFKAEGFVFDGSGGRWEKLAFSLYSNMVELSEKARSAIAKAEGRE